ncbi:MAG: hypothetical protein PHN45_08880 [Methylococcales bacterium]|nr:hypothetical protein [Methylococcales bacterium]MDD5754851.1 hypothetical protein [Methylococcales bacterium]
MKKLVFLTFGILINGVISTPALARPEYKDATGAKDCTVCHFDNLGKNPWKPGVLDAYFNNGMPGLIAFAKAGGSKDTAPVLSQINTQWDVTVGETPLDIPLHVFDKEGDTFGFHGSIPMKSASLSALHIDTVGNLPTQNLQWMPTAADANKTYTVSFYATENGAGRTLKSNVVTANISVWTARANATMAQVQDFKLSTANWSAGKLTLAGNVIFKPSVTAAERMTASDLLTLQLRSSSGLMVGSPIKLTLDKTGSWTQKLALSAAQVPCSIIGDYEGLNASRVVSSTPATCLK